jgi:uncharacterized protein YkwD
MKKRFIRLSAVLFLSISMMLSGVVPVMAETASVDPKDAASGIKTSAIEIQSGKQLNCSKAYKELNKFRTKKKQWQWKKGSKKKQYFNTKSSNKLGKLKRDKDLEKTAKKRAKEIAKRFDHTRPNGKSCFTIYPKKFRCMGENIAYGFNYYQTAKQETEGWAEENEKYGGQGHRRNMLEKHFKKVGIACYAEGGYYFWVQCFGG